MTSTICYNEQSTRNTFRDAEPERDRGYVAMLSISRSLQVAKWNVAELETNEGLLGWLRGDAMDSQVVDSLKKADRRGCFCSSFANDDDADTTG